MHLKRTADQRLARIRARARAANERRDYSKVQSYLPADPIGTAQVEAADERRRYRRVPVQSTVLVRRVGAFNFEVALKDISAGGCGVVMLEQGAVGDPVITRLPQLEPIGSRLCWAEGTETGLQFLRPMHPAVFDMLVTRLGGRAVRAS